MGFLELISLVVKILPALIQAVKAVEDALPDTGAGEHKLQAVKGILQAVAESAGTASSVFSTVWPALEKVIGVVVGMFNNTGTFATNIPTPPAVPVPIDTVPPVVKIDVPNVNWDVTIGS
jgi:hypothetical protein